MPELHEMSWAEAKGYFEACDIAVLPVGSTEQHGLHNPLGTDHLIARVVAEEAARQTGTLCLPAVPFGVSFHHRQFWGTVYVRPESLKAYVCDVCLSLSRYGVNKIVIVNGHGGNARTLLELARELREQGIFVSVFVWWEASKKRLPGIFSLSERGHAAAEETSVNLALHPRLVDMKKAVDEERKQLFPDDSVGVHYGADTADYSLSGVLGISKTASPEKGRRIVEAAVSELSRHIEALKKAKTDDLLSKPLR